jgi:hypothetical protein
MRNWALVLAGTLAASSGWPQSELRPARSPSAARLIEADRDILDSGNSNDGLGCRVEGLRPRLGFDLRYHVQYRARVSLKDLAGYGNRLRILVRVTPFGRPADPVYLIQRFTVPAIDVSTGGEANLPGAFLVGPGRYRVDWVLRDARDRVCSARWEVEAKNGDKDVLPSLAAHTAAARPGELFWDSPAPPRDSPPGALHLKIVANFSPADRRASALKPSDLEPLVSILRQLGREPAFGRFSLVAFNMNEERVIYQQGPGPRLDFRALGKAVSEVDVGTIDFRRLQDRESGSRFLTELLRENLGPQTPEPDAIVIVGPKLMLEKKVSEDVLRQAGRTGSPVFYLNYNLNPRRHPWRDAIASVLKLYQGLEYAIYRPRDLSAALNDLRARLAPMTRTAGGAQ